MATVVSAEQAVEDTKASGTGERITLDATVEEEGLNFSLGQRQMMALARARSMRGNPDHRVRRGDELGRLPDGAKIQNTIMTAFRGKTLLCIAHRLKTIIVSYDRIVVMDQERDCGAGHALSACLTSRTASSGACASGRGSRAREIASFCEEGVGAFGFRIIDLYS